MQNSIIYISNTSMHGGAEEALREYTAAAELVNCKPVLILPSPGWLSNWCNIKGIKVEYLSTIPEIHGSGWKRQFQYWLVNAVKIARLVKKHRALIVHSNKLQSLYHGGLGARLARVPSIVHLHDLGKLNQSANVKMAILRYLSDQAIFVSKALENRMLGLAPGFKGHTQTIYNGISYQAYNSIQPLDLCSEFRVTEHKKWLGVIGTIRQLKGQHIVLQAFFSLVDDYPNLNLVFVGDPRGSDEANIYQNELWSFALKYGLIGRVFFTGWREDSLRILAGLDILVHTPVEFDTLPTVLLHASALKKPVIASNIGGIPEIIDDNKTGLLVEPGDVLQTANAIRKLMDEPKLGTILASELFHRTERLFDRRLMLETISKVYSSYLV